MCVQEVTFGDGSVGKVYATSSAMFLRPIGAKSAANPGVEYDVDQKVEARLGHEEAFLRGTILSRRAVDAGGNTLTGGTGKYTDLARHSSLCCI